jgi:hypothetical protein
MEGWRNRHRAKGGFAFQSDIFRVIQGKGMRLLEHVTCMAETRNVQRILVEKFDRERQLKTCRSRWKVNILK